MLKQQNKKQLKNKSTQLESPNNFPACEKSKQISNSLFSTDDSANDDDSSNDNCSLNDSIDSIKQLSPLSQVSSPNSNVLELEEELLEKFYNNNVYYTNESQREIKQTEYIQKKYQLQNFNLNELNQQQKIQTKIPNIITKLLENILQYSQINTQNQTSTNEMTDIQEQQQIQHQFNCKKQKQSKMNINQFIQKIEQNLKYLNEDHYVIALYWIDQYVNKTGTEINSQNIDRLLIVSLMLTDKFYNDNCYQNIFVPYSKISQLKIQELKKLEIIFIEQLNYNLYLSDDAFQNYKNNIIQFNKSN